MWVSAVHIGVTRLCCNPQSLAGFVPTRGKELVAGGRYDRRVYWITVNCRFVRNATPTIK